MPDSILKNKAVLGAMVLLFAFGTFLRVYPSAGFKGMGFDENLYQRNVQKLQHSGLLYYPEIVQAHIEEQSRADTPAKLPPTRFLYIFCGYAWSSIFHVDAFQALKAVSCCFSILMLALTTLLAWRLGGQSYGLAVLALMSVAPAQIHMSQHALIDGFFAFWATLTLWLLWENLHRAGEAGGWLAAYGASIAAMVLTKENAFFVFVTVLGLLAAAHWLRYGAVTRGLVLMTFAGAAFGFILLLALSGGLKPFVETYRLLVVKAEHLPYAIQTGDGPWYRYLVDYLLMSPVVLLLAIGTLFALKRDDAPRWYLVLFILFSYILMTNVKNGMNLRYTNMWDMPLRFLAATQLFVLSSSLSRALRRTPQFVTVILFTALCVLELRQYSIMFVQNDLYELVTMELMRPVNIVKVRPFH